MPFEKIGGDRVLTCICCGEQARIDTPKPDEQVGGIFEEGFICAKCIRVAVELDTPDFALIRAERKKREEKPAPVKSPSVSGGKAVAPAGKKRRGRAKDKPS